jgi:zinc transporter
VGEVTTAPARVADSYGSDQTGLVWGYTFEPGAAATAIDADTALASLEAAAGERETFCWLHFSLANAASVRWLGQHGNLPPTFLDSLHDSGGSTRIEQDGEWLVVVIHDVLFGSAFDEADVSTVCLCVGPRVVVSARPKQLQSIDRLRAAVRAGETFRSPVDLLAHLLRDQANVLVEIVRHTTRRVDLVEDGLLRQRFTSSRGELGSMRRALVRLQRLLAPEPAALFRLLNRPPTWISEPDLQDLRQSAEEFNTAVADSAALVERVKLIQEELAALINEQNNRTLFVLTLVTVLALPFNVIASLFGMNVGGIPWAESRYGFAIVVAMTAMTAIFAYAMLQRRE